MLANLDASQTPLHPRPTCACDSSAPAPTKSRKGQTLSANQPETTPAPVSSGRRDPEGTGDAAGRVKGQALAPDSISAPLV
jgi:hypothetical protein